MYIPKNLPKIIQIAVGEYLYALDVNGNIWKHDFGEWILIPTKTYQPQPAQKG